MVMQQVSELLLDLYRVQLGNYYRLLTFDILYIGGVDYDSQQYFGVFPAGEVVAYVLVDIMDDALLEGTEYFSAELTIPDVATGYGVRAGSNSKATVNILDDEEEIFINFAPVNYTYNEGDGEAILTLVASGVFSMEYSVQVTTSNGSATGK